MTSCVERIGWLHRDGVEQAGLVEESLFDDVGDILVGVAPPELGECRYRAHRYGIKVWFGPEKPIREHYEAQVIGAQEVKDASVLASRSASTPSIPRKPTTTR